MLAGPLSALPPSKLRAGMMVRISAPGYQRTSKICAVAADCSFVIVEESPRPNLCVAYLRFKNGGWTMSDFGVRLSVV
jgi:hypothetical protein